VLSPSRWLRPLASLGGCPLPLLQGRTWLRSLAAPPARGCANRRSIVLCWQFGGRGKHGLILSSTSKCLPLPLGLPRVNLAGTVAFPPGPPPAPSSPCCQASSAPLPVRKAGSPEREASPAFALGGQQMPPSPVPWCRLPSRELGDPKWCSWQETSPEQGQLMGGFGLQGMQGAAQSEKCAQGSLPPVHHHLWQCCSPPRIWAFDGARGWSFLSRAAGTLGVAETRPL